MSYAKKDILKLASDFQNRVETLYDQKRKTNVIIDERERILCHTMRRAFILKSTPKPIQNAQDCWIHVFQFLSDLKEFIRKTIGEASREKQLFILTRLVRHRFSYEGKTAAAKTLLKMYKKMWKMTDSPTMDNEIGALFLS